MDLREIAGVPETLMTAVLIGRGHRESQVDPSFQEELNQLFAPVCRTWNTFFTTRKTFDPVHNGGAKIYLKREDLNHTGASTINNA